MFWLLNMLLGRRIARATHNYLEDLSHGAERKADGQIADLLSQLAVGRGEKVVLGQTESEIQVAVPAREILRTHSVVTGGTGSGKTRFALGIISSLIDELPGPYGFGLIDPKGDLFAGTLGLIALRIQMLQESDPQRAEALRQRVVIFDFASRDPLSSYNILAQWPGVDPDFFASVRAEMILDLLSGGDKLSLAGTGVLQKLLRLLSDQGLSITSLEDVLADKALLAEIVSQSQNEVLQTYFARHYPTVPQSTIAAIRRRIEALFASESVRLTLSGVSAPDLRALQDSGAIVLVNCFGESLSRGTRRLLQGLVLADVRQSIFCRQNRENPYLWLVDEAQNLFVSESLRDDMTDILTMSRSFGSHLMLLTQNMTTAVQDARLLKVLYTNIGWSFSLRGEPGDCAFLKNVIPATGRKQKPQIDPFQGRTFYSLSEERALSLDAIGSLPDRLGYLWLRKHLPEAFLMRTKDLVLPEADDAVTASVKNDPGFGSRQSREAYEARIAERDNRRTSRQVPAPNGIDLTDTLISAYHRGGGQEEGHVG